MDSAGRGLDSVEASWMEGLGAGWEGLNAIWKGLLDVRYSVSVAVRGSSFVGDDKNYLGGFERSIH